MAAPLTPPVEVAGLEIPADLAPQIVSAFRTLYPTVTEDKDDDAAVRAVLIWLITSALETHANRQVNTELDVTINQLRSQADAKQTAIRGQIQAAAKRIKEKPATPSEDTP